MKQKETIWSHYKFFEKHFEVEKQEFLRTPLSIHNTKQHKTKYKEFPIDKREKKKSVDANLGDVFNKNQYFI